MNIASAVFECSAPNLAACPDETIPEFAFIGRSNVGKSSLVNMLTGREGLAKVSPIPGFTKLLNFFVINRRWRLVDLPGYGYAKVAREDSAQFNEAVNEYLRERRNLFCVFVLIDSRLEPQGIDLEFLQGLGTAEVPFVLVFTKNDALPKDQVAANMALFRRSIEGWFEKMPVMLTCSAKENRGKRELLAVIQSALEEEDEKGQGAGGGGGKVKLGTKGYKPKKPNPARPW